MVAYAAMHDGMTLPIFPVQLFRPKAVNARPVVSTISGGTSLSGIEDVIATDGGGRWVVEYSDIQLRTPEQLRAWSAWAGYLAGGTVECLVPIVSLATGPRPFAWDGPARVSKLVADDPVFPQSVAYSIPQIQAVLATDIPLRGTLVAINLISRGEITGGEKFSIAGNGFRVVRETAPGVYQVTPPARQALEAGADVNFDWPVVRCRLQPNFDMEAAINMGRFMSPSITFVESPPVGGI